MDGRQLFPNRTVEGLPVMRKLGGSELPLSFGPFLSSLNEFFDKISNDQSTSTIEMDAVGVKAPAIDPGDFVGGFGAAPECEKHRDRTKETRTP